MALIDAGGLLERLTGHPNQRGIELFFWDREYFSESWCRERLQSTIATAGQRYSPELHVDLPIAFALDGLAGSSRFWERYQDLRLTAARRAQHMRRSRHPGLGVTDELVKLRRRLREWDAAVPGEPDARGSLDAAAALALTRRALDATVAARPMPPSDDARNAAQERFRSRRRDLRTQLDRLLDALSGFAALLTSDAAKARTTGGLLLRGDAGQGKTHLFCDAGKRLLDQGHPALVMLGSRFRGPGPWRDLSEHVGLGDVGSEALIGAMAAAAEAAGRPFVLLIDALNESRDPQMWLDELPAMVSAAAASPWLAVGFSYRSSFEEVIVREAGIGECAQAEHRGFEGREAEAAESFFEHFGLEAPRIPLLIPEFTNPLFLKLYCEGNEESQGEENVHLSDVFAAYLEAKERAVCLRLRIDSRSAPVKAAGVLGAARGEPRRGGNRETRPRTVGSDRRNRSRAH